MTQPSPDLARAILSTVGSVGQPPNVGVEHINVGNETALGVLQREYLAPIAESRRGSAFKLVQGYYGGGKTHFLLCVRQRAWSLGLCSAVVSLSPSECPFHDTAKIYASVARELSWPPVDASVAPGRGIDQALATALDERRMQLDEEGLRAWIKDTVRNLPVDAPAWRNAMVAFFRARLDEDIEKEELAAAWLRGEELSPAEAKSIGVREAIDKTNGLRMLRSLCQGLQGIGAPGLLLAFDEVDRVMSLPPKLRRVMADHLRELIDACGREQLPGLLCLYAVPPDFMSNVVNEYPALQQRLKGPQALSEKSPQAAMIDLEELDLPPRELLVQIGLKLLDLFEIAYAPGLDREQQRQNLIALAAEIHEAGFEVAHRRAFVKAAVDMLHGQRQAPGSVSRAALRTLASRGQELVAIDGGAGSDEEEF